MGSSARDGAAGATAVVVCEASEDQVGEGAESVQRREEVLGVVEEVSSLTAGVMGRNAGQHEHWHDERGLEDRAT